MIKVKFITLGCPKNQVDSEYMIGMLMNKNNLVVVDNPERADTIVINTCGFINDAKKESIETIFDAIYYKKEGFCKSIIVTGCLTQRYKKKLMEEIPEIDAILGTGNFDRLPEVVEKSMEKNHNSYISSPTFNYNYHLPRHLYTKHYAYLKVSEGCNNNCTYCTIPKIRGPLNSRSIDDIVKEAEKLSEKGIKEIILIAQDLTQYGNDLYENPKLVPLLKKLVEIKGLQWIRLMYTYPERISMDLIKLIKKEPKICNYLDIPIQHSSNKIRKKMGRKGSKRDLINIIKTLRKEIPDITLRTSLIVGFPGETKSDFKDLLGFVERIKFNRLGVFKYSREEGTAAYNFEPQIDEKTKVERYEQIMEIQKKISLNKNKKMVNREIKVLIDKVYNANEYAVGRSQYDAPEVDNQIIIEDKGLSAGKFINCRVVEAYEYDLFAKRIGESRNENKSSE